MPTIVYNNYKAQDIYENGPKLKGTYFILNNCIPDATLVSFLDETCIKWWLCLKLSDALPMQYYKDIGVKRIAIDAENYYSCKPGYYTFKAGSKLRKLLLGLTDELLLLPEDLGGDKYFNYSDFVMGLDPEIVVLERTYQCWWPWDLFKFFQRNTNLQRQGRKVFLGLWIERIPPLLRSIQSLFANLISGGNTMFYSETKEMPK